ncbi:hypothetical protein A0H81_02793 [Grifola frondosa]|uniref:Secreted protein n=1 Tax=Grifola frondosa TaxID=5627 RepID=A0A1C7MKK4_GRIFR|nr:hypothetical protein A0H81_02793 [Grifola frondosa]
MGHAPGGRIVLVHHSLLLLVSRVCCTAQKNQDQSLGIVDPAPQLVAAFQRNNHTRVAELHVSAIFKRHCRRRHVLTNSHRCPSAHSKDTTSA